jgi:hypothetical protein
VIDALSPCVPRCKGGSRFACDPRANRRSNMPERNGAGDYSVARGRWLDHISSARAFHQYSLRRETLMIRKTKAILRGTGRSRVWPVMPKRTFRFRGSLTRRSHWMQS